MIENEICVQENNTRTKKKQQERLLQNENENNWENSEKNSLRPFGTLLLESSTRGKPSDL